MSRKYGMNAEEITAERRQNFELLEILTNENQSLQKSATARLSISAVISLLSIVIGTIFLILKPSEISNTILNSVAEIICGSFLLLGIQSLASGLRSKNVDTKIQSNSKISDEVIQLSLENLQDKSSIESVVKIMKERNKNFKTWGIWWSSWIIVFAIILICIIFFNIFVNYVAQDERSIRISVELILLSSGISCFILSIITYLVLWVPSILGDFFSSIFFLPFSFILFIQLFMVRIIRFNCETSCDDITVPLYEVYTEILEEDIEVPLCGSESAFTIVRIVLEKREKLNIKRILHGLKPKNIRDPEVQSDFFNSDIL
ncbi:15415_t:CDS:1 [Acaulospora morrowiae]|uniref:15415_t:CDS:1 n=1 Tax=Acaulospora morrowiae TaxID=94023 RepID=A0A9N8Z3W0_9GLOM|nr:15415_t:CDS:1 [Acaulospora morrowiae]